MTHGKLSSCLHGKGPLAVTAIIDSSGSLLTAGANEPNPGSADAAECVVHTLKNMHFPSPGSWPARVSFSVE